jgi:hypothetical protein
MYDQYQFLSIQEAFDDMKNTVENVKEFHTQKKV